MLQPREPWNIRPAKKRASVTASLKTEVETKARDLIENVLKPRHVLLPPKKDQGNYLIDIGAKWYRGYFYFTLTYACPGPNALSPRWSGCLLGWNRSVTARLPSMPCDTQERNGLAF